MPVLFFKGASLCKHACHTEGKACVLCLSRRLGTKFLLSLSRHRVLSISKQKKEKEKRKKFTWSSKTIAVSFILWVILPTNALFIYERENKQCQSLDNSNPANLKTTRPGPRPNQPRKHGMELTVKVDWTQEDSITEGRSYFTRLEMKLLFATYKYYNDPRRKFPHLCSRMSSRIS